MGLKDLFSRKKEEPKVEEKPVQPEEKKEEHLPRLLNTSAKTEQIKL